MSIIGTIASLIWISLVLIDAFETILQPRRVMHRFRLARTYYRGAWTLWRTLVVRLAPGKRREAILSTFGPLSLLGLFTSWVIGLIFGFGLLHRSLGTALAPSSEAPTFLTYLYLSGSTFFTLGYGDITPAEGFGRTLTVAEAGLGFGFLAVVIGYLPVMYQAYSRRESTISLLDARAGSPPTAAEVLVRLARSGDVAALDAMLASWEKWAGELLESHLSFPVLSYYRSQHDNQSWLAALTTMLDACAINLAEVKGRSTYQAQLTFAMARHAAVDLALVLKLTPVEPTEDRLPVELVRRLRDRLREAGVELHERPVCESRLAELRGMYEPFVNALAARLLFTLPPVMSDKAVVDNWQRSAWMGRPPGIGNLPIENAADDHFI